MRVKKQEKRLEMTEDLVCGPNPSDETLKGDPFVPSGAPVDRPLTTDFFASGVPQFSETFAKFGGTSAKLHNKTLTSLKRDSYKPMELLYRW